MARTETPRDHVRWSYSAAERAVWERLHPLTLEERRAEAMYLIRRGMEAERQRLLFVGAGATGPHVATAPDAGAPAESHMSLRAEATTMARDKAPRDYMRWSYSTADRAVWERLHPLKPEARHPEMMYLIRRGLEAERQPFLAVAVATAGAGAGAEPAPIAAASVKPHKSLAAQPQDSNLGAMKEVALTGGNDAQVVPPPSGAGPVEPREAAADEEDDFDLSALSGFTFKGSKTAEAVTLQRGTS